MPMTNHSEMTAPTGWSAQAPQLRAWTGEARLFFGVAPTAAQQQQLAALQGQFPATVRTVALANLHLTLRFLGQVSYAQALAMCQQLDDLLLEALAVGGPVQFTGTEPVAGLPRDVGSPQNAGSAHSDTSALPPLQLPQQQPQRQFHVRLDTIEWWAGPAVLCLAGQVTDPALAALDHRLDTLALAQGLAPRQHPLRPHITLARPARHPLPLPAPVIELIGRELLLYHSCSSPTGVQYLPLARWPLIQQVNGAGSDFQHT
ncbi:MAG TPA: hypothetical protein DCS87_08115 [Rheinheimera sp.]|nr:hypothetical protein [Rheinheimera sp.]